MCNVFKIKWINCQSYLCTIRTTDESAYYALLKPGCQNKPQMLDLTVTLWYVLTEIRLRLIKELEVGCARWWTRNGPPISAYEIASAHNRMKYWVSFRPHYLPRELGQVMAILVYIPGPDDTGAAERVTECYNRRISRSIDQAVYVLRDFNSCDITSLLPDLSQSVTCPTRFNKTIDLCYSNIPYAFRALCRPALGQLNHNVIHLVPKYRQRVNHEKQRHWETLRGCFDCTDWQVFYDGCSDNDDEIADTVTSYIQFFYTNENC